MGGSDVTFTLLMSVVSVGALLGALAAARRTSVDITVVSWAALLFGVAMGLLTISPDLALAFVFSFLLGLASTTFMTTSTAIVQIRSDPTMRGRVLALQAIVFLGSTPSARRSSATCRSTTAPGTGWPSARWPGWVPARSASSWCTGPATTKQLPEGADADALALQLTSRRPA